MKNRYLILKAGLFSISFFLALSVEARTVRCLGDYYISTGCPSCPNGSMVCRGRQIFVKHTTPLEYIKVVVTRDGTQKTHTLRNPPGQISDYASIESNRWVQENIPGGFRSGDIIEVAQASGYGIDSSVSWYESYESEVPKSSVKDLKRHKKRQACWYIDTVNAIINPSSSENTKSDYICQGTVKCGAAMVGASKPFQVVCKAKEDRSCPTAGYCATESKVEVATANSTDMFQGIGNTFKNFGDRIDRGIKAFKQGSGSGSE